MNATGTSHATWASTPALRPPIEGNMPRQLSGEMERVLLVQAQTGDRRAERVFVEHHQARVYALATRLLGDAAEAQDVAQESFLRALAALPRFDPNGPAKLSTWLLTICTRQCLDVLRRRRRQNTVHLEAAAHIAAADVTEPHALERALAERTQRALLTLPDDMRATFVLRVLMDFSVSEAAAALQIDEGTVKSRLSRARTQLRAAIGEV